MATAEAKVCNRALIRIGQLQLIDSLDDDSELAEACKQIFDEARDETLEAFAWPFASKRSALALITDGERTGWAYAYSLPTDCLAPRFLAQDDNAPPASARIPFKMEERVLLTNIEDAELVYTAKIEGPGSWSPMFRSALAWKLAEDLALGVLKKPAVADMMAKRFWVAVRAAAASVFNQETRPEAPDSDIILERE